jgi:hypothetical protein
MQNRYKINNSAEGKKPASKANQNHKNDVLSYINQLDKCARTFFATQKFSERTEFGFAISWKRTTRKSWKSSKKLNGR